MYLLLKKKTRLLIEKQKSLSINDGHIMLNEAFACSKLL